MSDLIDDLLVAARSTVGNVKVRHERVNLKREIESVVSSFLDTGESTVTVNAEPGHVTTESALRIRTGWSERVPPRAPPLRRGE